MSFVNVSELKPGMVVLSAVSNKHGNVLLKKANVLYDPYIIDAFKKSWSRGNLQEIIPPKQFHEEM